MSSNGNVSENDFKKLDDDEIISLCGGYDKFKDKPEDFYGDKPKIFVFTSEGRAIFYSDLKEAVENKNKAEKKKAEDAKAEKKKAEDAKAEKKKATKPKKPSSDASTDAPTDAPTDVSPDKSEASE